MKCCGCFDERKGKEEKVGLDMSVEPSPPGDRLTDDGQKEGGVGTPISGGSQKVYLCSEAVSAADIGAAGTFLQTYGTGRR